MSRSEIPQVRITTEVETDTRLLPEAIVWKAEQISCENGIVVASGRSGSYTLPSEAMVRELRDADLDTQEGVLALITVLGLDFAGSIDVSGLGLLDQRTVAPGQSPSSPLIIEGLYMDPRVLVATASHGPGTRMLEGTIIPTGAPDEYGMTLRCGHWSQIAQRLRLVRAAVNHYVAYCEGKDLSAAWEDEGFSFRIEHELLGSSVPARPAALLALGESPEADAWRVFIAVHAYLSRDHVPALTVWLNHDQAALKVFALPCSVAAALIVQLHNMLVDGLAIRRCANETCGRPFTRQRGRALKGQYRNTGVIYCDASCAKAQMQREYRRRARQKAQNAASQ